jgi:type III restriction enzyme
MELKNFQRAVLEDLASFLSEYASSGSPEQAFASYWASKPFSPGLRYMETVHGAPNVCIKVPTGGGKTFIACNALKIIADRMPSFGGRPVVWFVPSLSILDQTLRGFRSPDHPYHQKLKALFAGRVVVLEKGEALSGASFDPETVRRQLTILVVSYDSFRSTTKEGRKVYQENSSLVGFPMQYGHGTPIERADESSLAQVLNSMRPVIIVDESHNAKSTLSVEMLRNLNPAFILELTATPRDGSNIISYVDPEKLKQEQMVKLPVIVYNTKDANEVVRTTIDLRRKLELSANAEATRGAAYVRPIALVQAEPKNSRTEEENQTFARLKEKLIGFGIPGREIAIKTAEIDELRGIDLLSPECPIRFVLTVNALKEGWDCPFAYVLASLANRSSAVDVERISPTYSLRAASSMRRFNTSWMA